MQKQVVYIEIEPSDPNTMLKDAIEATSTSAGLTFMMNTKVEIVDQLLSDPSVYDHTLFLIR